MVNPTPETSFPPQQIDSSDVNRTTVRHNLYIGMKSNEAKTSKSQSMARYDLALLRDHHQLRLQTDNLPLIIYI